MELKARIYRMIEDGRPVKAVLEMQVGKMVIKNIRIVQTPDGRLVMAMPSKKKNGRYEDLVYPTTEGMMAAMAKEALRAYEKEKNGESSV